jgi:hypothetical protein
MMKTTKSVLKVRTSVKAGMVRRRGWILAAVLASACTAGAAPIGSTAAAATGTGSSDVVRIQSIETATGVHGTVAIERQSGPSIPAAIGGSGEIFDLLGNAGEPSFDAEPYFEDGTPRLRLVFDPVRIAPGQLFYGLVGMDVDAGSALSPDDFRERVFANYEAEVDGIVVPGSQLTVVGPWSCFGTEACTGFALSQRIDTPGTHRVVYRHNNLDTLGDCAADCFPAGHWEWEFTVIVDPAVKPARGNVGKGARRAIGRLAAEALRR